MYPEPLTASEICDLLRSDEVRNLFPFELEFPEEAAILMEIYAQRPKHNLWVKEKRRFVPHYFPEVGYMKLENKHGLEQ